MTQVKQQVRAVEFGAPSLVKDTWYLWGKNSENLQLLDVLASNLANKPSFQNPTKNHFTQRSLDGKSAVTF